MTVLVLILIIKKKKQEQDDYSGSATPMWKINIKLKVYLK